MSVSGILFFIFFISYCFLVRYLRKHRYLQSKQDPYVSDLIKDFKQKNHQEKISSEKEIIEILEPRFFIIPQFIQMIFRLGVIILLAYLIYLFFNHLEDLAKNCQPFYNLNAFFVKDLFTLMVIIIPIIALIMSSIISIITKHLKKSDNKLNIKPYLFTQKVINADTKNDRDFSIFITNWFSTILFFSLLFSPSSNIIIDFSNELVEFDINTINQSYDQKCQAREKPFHKLKDKRD